jgi:hypothetical protein
LHHDPKPIDAICRLAEHVRPGGWLHVAEVGAGSRVGEFLNGFVDRHNPMGHRGTFLPTRRAAYPAHWNLARLEPVSCAWRFDSPATMTRFCQLMFGLEAGCEDALLEALGKIVGVTSDPRGVELAWELLYLDLRCD